MAAMMRVTVTFATGRAAAYDAPADSEVGDRVVVLFGSEWPKVIEGTITALASDYTGPARTIEHRCRRSSGDTTALIARGQVTPLEA